VAVASINPVKLSSTWPQFEARAKSTFHRLFDIHRQFTWRLLALTFLPVGAPDNCCKHNQLGVELIQDTFTHTLIHTHTHLGVSVVPLPPT